MDSESDKVGAQLDPVSSKVNSTYLEYLEP